MSHLHLSTEESERHLDNNPSTPSAAQLASHTTSAAAAAAETSAPLRRSARVSGQHAQSETPQESTTTAGPLPNSPNKKRKRGEQEIPEEATPAESSTSRRRLSNSNAQGHHRPSAKALGKRRAVSPEPSEAIPEEDSLQHSTQSNKRRKSNTASLRSDPPSTSSSTAYNLRSSRQESNPVDTAATTAHAATSVSSVKPSKSSRNRRTSKSSMPKKGAAKTTGSSGKAKARAEAEGSAAAEAAAHEEAHQEAGELLPPSGDRSSKKRSKRRAARSSPPQEVQADDAGSSSQQQQQQHQSPHMEIGEAIDDLQEPEDPDLSFFANVGDHDEDEDEDEFHSGEEDPEDIFDAQFDQQEHEDDEEDPMDDDEDDDEHDMSEALSARAAAAMIGAHAGDLGGGLGGGLGAANALFGGFGASLASFGMMSGLGSRLKAILNQLRDSSGEPDPTQKLVALQELSEILSISTEDTLAGFFNVDAFVKEFINILSVGSECASVVDLYGEESGVEMMLLACRCLANLMEALPGSSHSVVHAGAVPILCSKLLEIQYIDLAEQTLSTLEKIASEVPGAVVREGGLTALLSYLDFFSTNIQRTAVTAAAHCCRSLSPDSFSMVRDVAPILQNVLGYADQRVVEQACLAVTRIIESYRHYPDKLEQLLTPDLIAAVLALLTPGSSLLGTSTFTSVLRALAMAARASAKVAMELIEGQISGTLYHLLAGSAPPAPGDEIAGVQKRRDEDDMAVLQNLVHRPKDQVLEALVLVSELLPALPRDGLFSPKPNASRSRAGKRPGSPAKVKKEEDAAPVPSHGALAAPLDVPNTSVAEQEASPSRSQPSSVQPSADVLAQDEEAIAAAAQVKTEERSPSIDLSAMSTATPATAPASTPSGSLVRPAVSNKEAANDQRIELLQSDTPPERRAAVARFQALLLPTLIDVYSASVGISVRIKSMLGLTKLIHFATREQLAEMIETLPVASFLGAILASKDQPMLVTNGLQVVELLLLKLPDQCNYLFRRQGVLHEVEQLAEADLNTPQVDKDKTNTSSSSSKPETEVARSAAPGGASRGFLLGSLARSSASAAETAASEAANDAHLKDLVTLRARFMRDRYCSANATSASALQAAQDLQTIKGLVQKLEEAATPAQQKPVLSNIARLFTNTAQPISSFELQESGLVSALLHFAVEANALPPLEAFARRKLLAEALVVQQEANSPQALSILVKCLQDSLSRLEDFEVKTALPGASDDRRNPAHMLTRQLKFKLVAEDSVVPRSCSNVIVAIHAIATFQAFNEYLRPRISAASGGTGAGGVLAAAFAAAAAGASEEVEQPFQANEEVEEPAQGQEGPEDTSSRRRSSRLSGRNLDAGADQNSTATPQDDTQDPIDEQVEGDASREEATTNVEPAPDGSRLEGHTPGGTRVATPAGTSRPAAPSRARGSYAAALKTTPSDWHLKFFMGDQELSLDTTVYGAVHQFEAAQNNQSARTMWSNVYTIRFKKCPGPPTAPSPRTSPEPVEDDVNLVTALPDSVLPDSKEAKIMQLLRVLHNLNSDLPELLDGQPLSPPLPVVAFVNNKLTAKLNRQLEEPMIVASSCLPEWALDLPQSFPFLFPFETRFSFLQSTSFGYARLMAKWVAAARQESRRDDSLSSLGRLSRQKVRISRDMLLGSAFKVFELYATSRAMIEIEFFSEVGTGLGPTLEFYALVSREFSRKDLDIWRAGDDNPTNYIQSKTGLFPAPLPSEEDNGERTERAISIFRLLAQFLAKGLLDSRMTDVAFNRTFMKLIQDQDVPLTVSTVKTVDPSLGRSLEDLRLYVDRKEAILADPHIEDKSAALDTVRVKDAAIEDLSLDFTLPGYPHIELRPGGADIPVTIDNVHEYVDLVVDYTLSRGVQKQVKAFREAFSQVFPVKDLACFSAEELSIVFGNGTEDWSQETLQDALRADHGFSMEAKPVKELLDIMHHFSDAEKRLFLRFATGSPRLPVGGFRALHPPLTVVRKPPESGHHADEYLPSVMTCQNYIKLPEYSDRPVMEERLKTAITEGQGAFHLS